MTPGQEESRPEQLTTVWETLPLPNLPDEAGWCGEQPGSTPGGSGGGRQWETYSPPASERPGGIVAEPPPATAPKPRPVSAWGAAVLVAVLVIGVGSAASSWRPPQRPAISSTTDAQSIAASEMEARLISQTPLPGVVAVYGSQFSTSGLVVDADGTVVVPYHPLATADSAQISVRAPGHEPMVAEMRGFDATEDIAVLSVPGLQQAEVPRLAAESMAIGDQVDVSGYAVTRFGAGSDYASTVTTGILDTEARATVELVWTEFFSEVSGLLELRLDPAADGGVGQVVYAAGDVVGLVIDQAGDSGFAVPVAKLTQIVSTVRAGVDRGSVRVGPPGSLGLSFGANSVDSEGWPYVATVEPFGPAAAAGIKEGNVLISVGDVSLNTFGKHSISPAAALRMLEPGAPVEVTWRSGASGKEQTETIVATTARGY